MMWNRYSYLYLTENSNSGHFCQIEWTGERSEVAEIAIFDYFQIKVSSGPDF